MWAAETTSGQTEPVKSTRNALHVTQVVRAQPFASGTLPNASPVVVNLAGATLPATVWVAPGSGCTIRVEFSDDGVRYDRWPQGDVTAYTRDVLESSVHSLRFTRIAGTAADSSYGIR